jgi:hypothetical protein
LLKGRSNSARADHNGIAERAIKTRR